MGKMKDVPAEPSPPQDSSASESTSAGNRRSARLAPEIMAFIPKFNPKWVKFYVGRYFHYLRNTNNEERYNETILQSNDN